MMMIIFTSDDSNVEVDQMSIQSSTSRCTSREMSDGILKSLEYSIEKFVLFLHQIKSDQINYAMKDYSL
jgi:hypothetical protein